MLKIKLEHAQIDCTVKKLKRKEIIDNFVNAVNMAIIVNVHILDEGIDILECDSVYITQPNDNMINIIQRMSRANRIMENKNECNIYLWCSEKKRDKIIKYIYDKMDGYIRNKVIINNVNNNTMCKYDIDDISGNNCIDMDIYQKLLKYTTIDREFLETFFKKFKTGGKIEFNMKEDNVAKYLGIKLPTLRKRLLNFYSNTINFKEEVDYIRIRNGKYITYMINYQCFERLAMTGDSEQSEIVRSYFVKLHDFFVANYN